MTSGSWISDSRWLYTLLVALVAAGRLVELAVSRRNERWLLARGAVELGRGHYRWMVLLHTAYLIGCPLEVWWLGRPFVPPLAAAMTLLLAASVGLRYAAIAALGRRWTTRILCLPGAPVVTRGPYRHLRHPNYLAVVLELLALPLIHTAWLTALLAGAGNALVLATRIRVEEAGLAEHSQFATLLGHRPAFIPRPR